MDNYLVPSGDSEIEFTERRSRFIGRVWVCNDESEALGHIKDMREKHWDATHNVYAYIIRGGATRYSDDGEPSGTAGMPVLEVFRREGINNVCCVVTRYFGGILLGAGGLVRAYAAAAKQALDAAGVSEMRRRVRAELNCPYALFERVKLEAAALGGTIDAAEFGADVELAVLLPEENSETFAARVTELSSGTVAVSVTGESLEPVPVK